MRDHIQIINLTRTPLNFISKGGESIVIPTSGEAVAKILRVEQSYEAVYGISPIRVNETRILEVKGLPPYREGYGYIVPSLVYQNAHHYRPDIYVIDEPVKEDKIVKTARAIARPAMVSNTHQIKEVKKILSDIDFDNKEDIVNKIFEAKSIIDKMVK